MPQLLALALAALGLIVLPAGAQAVRIPVEQINAFQASRRTDPGPTRLEALRELARRPHARNLPLFLEALADDCGAILKVDKKVAKIDGQAERQRKALRRLLERNPDEVSERRTALESELDTVKGDLYFRRQQIVELRRECALLRRGLVDAAKTLDSDAAQKFRRDLAARFRRARSWPLRRELLSLLAVVGGEELLTLLAQRLKDDKDPSLRAQAACRLGTATDKKAAEAALLPALEDASPLVRSQALRSLRKVGARDTVDALIARVVAEDGRLQEELLVTLRGLTGVNYFDNVTLWQEWWTKERPNYVPWDGKGRRRKPGEKGAFGPLEASGEGAGFYGIRTRSESLVFLIDVSGSMNEPASAQGTTGGGKRDETKLQRAQRELIRTLDGLPVGVMVNVAAYGTDIDAFSDRMVKLTARSRRLLNAWIRSLQADGQTNLHDALMWAMDLASLGKRRRAKKFPVETVYLLTDGRPTAGRITNQDQIAVEVARRNERIGVVIHTVAVGRDAAKRLLQRIAADSAGIHLTAR